MSGMNNLAGVSLSRSEVLNLVVRLSIISAATYFSVRWLVQQMDPTNKSKTKAKAEAQERLRRLGLQGNHSVNQCQLNDHEMMIAAHLVVPDEISVTWKDIAGLDLVIEELKETVILPIQRRDLFADSTLTQPPKGVLLHGPPGVGKTLIAKATAREAKTRFINLDLSILTDKWYGESQKLTAAVFSLAVKLQPCIIFIDEIDSFLRSRNQHDHEATAMMKAQFMSLWDGLITDPNCTVIIMGATNRPQDLDKAIQRRMPATFRIGLPDQNQRESILQLILQNEPISSDVIENLHKLAKLTQGFSGSDLRELCRNASMFRVRDYIKEKNNPTSSNNKTSDETDEEYEDALRPITIEDLYASHRKLKYSNEFTDPTSRINANLDLD